MKLNVYCKLVLYCKYINMTHTITTNLANHLYQFVDKEAKSRKVTKRSIIEKGLKLYRKKQLEKQVEDGFRDRYDEYKQINKELRPLKVRSISRK